MISIITTKFATREFIYMSIGTDEDGMDHDQPIKTRRFADESCVPVWKARCDPFLPSNT